MPNGDTSLRGALSRYAAAPASREDIRALVTFCHRMAVAYLRVKSAGGGFSPARFGLTAEDLAFDSIADLFQRDETGAFPMVRTFVARVSPAGEASDAQLENSLRRFVCSLVNRRIFDLYRQFDPSLARIIRNIKLAALTHPDITTAEHFGEKVLVPRRAPRLNTHLPVMAPELLLADLLARLDGSRTLKRMLSALAEVLCEQDIYRRLLPVSQAALAVRSALAAARGTAESSGEPFDFSEEDVMRIVDRTLGHLRCTRGPAYLRRGRLTQRELEAHLAAVRDLLLRDFGDPGRDHTPFFTFLQTHLRELEPKAYRERHRCILEYFFRTAKTTAREYLQADL